MLFGMNSLHPDLLPSQIKKDQNDEQGFYQLITSLFINPFSDNNELISLSRGLTPTERAAAEKQNLKTKLKLVYIEMTGLKRLKLARLFNSVPKVIYLVK